MNEIVQNINELNDQIKIHKQPFEDLGTLSEKLLNFRIYPSNGSRLYVIDPFYKKLEVTELCYSGEFKMFFKYHKSFDLSNFRISILYYSHTGKQVYSYQPILQPPKNSDQEFLECEINDNRIKQSVVSAKVHLIHENKRIQTYFKKVEAKNGSFQITETPSLKLNKLQSKRNSLIKRIRERENNKMELKASFLFDTSLKGSNKEHEKNISKAIAGFMNSHEGGTLFIGVDKDSNIVGLDNDYSIVKNYNSDRFELQLRNSLEKYLKRKIIHELIKVNFHHIKRKKICEIIISPSSKPIILYDNGKQEFYVRIGNSTRPYNIEEFFEYSKTRFKNEY